MFLKGECVRSLISGGYGMRWFSIQGEFGVILGVGVGLGNLHVTIGYLRGDGRLVDELEGASSFPNLEQGQVAAQQVSESTFTRQLKKCIQTLGHVLGNAELLAEKLNRRNFQLNDLAIVKLLLLLSTLNRAWQPVRQATGISIVAALSESIMEFPPIGENGAVVGGATLAQHLEQFASHVISMANLTAMPTGMQLRIAVNCIGSDLPLWLTEITALVAVDASAAHLTGLPELQEVILGSMTHLNQGHSKRAKEGLTLVGRTVFPDYFSAM